MDVKFEYLGEDRDFEGAKIYRVEALHVITTRNNRKFTRSEMELAGRSLSFRPLNINHEENRQLRFPENATLFMEFDPESMSVKGSFRVLDSTVNAMIETRRIKQVSIEQIPAKGESCNEITCEQHGVAFIGMALLESDVMPGDPQANIKMESLLISNAQRTCKECTDFVPCHDCKHKGEIDQSMQACLDQIQRDQPQMPQDERVFHCLEILNRVNKPAFKSIAITLNEQNDCMEKCLSAKKAKGTKIDDQAIAICLSECGLSRKEYVNYFYRILKEKYG